MSNRETLADTALDATFQTAVATFVTALNATKTAYISAGGNPATDGKTFVRRVNRLFKKMSAPIRIGNGDSDDPTLP